MRLELVVADLVLLQRADHRRIIGIVGHLQALGLHHQRRQLAHHRAGFHVLQLGTLHQQGRIDVHAHFLELEGVQLGRQAGVGTRLGQHFLLRPGDVVLHLRGQLGQRRVGTVDPVLGEQLADAGDVGVDVGQGLVDLDFGRLQQVGRAALFLIALARQGSQRLRAGGLAQIGLQAIQGLGPARFRYLVGEQAVDAAKHRLRHIHPWHQVLFVEGAALDVALGRGDQDLQVLAHIGVALHLQLLAQLVARLAQRRAVTVAVVRAQIDNLVVVTRHAEEAGHLRLERCLRLQQDLRQFIAMGNPGRCGRCCLGRCRCCAGGERQRGGQGQGDGKDERFHGQLHKGWADRTQSLPGRQG